MLIALLTACVPESTPISTAGEPATVTIQPAAGEGLAHTVVELEVRQVVLETCSGHDRDTVLDAQLELLAGDTLPLSAGEWCDGISIEIEDLILQGTGETTGSSYTLKLSFDEIRLIIPDTLSLDGQQLYLELGEEGWIDEEILGLSEGDVSIGAVHWQHDELADAVARRSLLYADTDGSGGLSDSDARLAAGFDREE